MTKTMVLIVDDEAPFVDALSRRLSKRDLSVVSAFNGQEALDKLASEEAARVDVAVLDIRMPGMNGLEVLAVIKQKYPLIEVILLTGHATIESAIEGMKLGAFDYLMKPCDLDTLISKVEEACRKKREQDDKIIRARAEMISLRRGD